MTTGVFRVCYVRSYSMVEEVYTTHSLYKRMDVKEKCQENFHSFTSSVLKKLPLLKAFVGETLVIHRKSGKTPKLFSRIRSFCRLQYMCIYRILENLRGKKISCFCRFACHLKILATHKFFVL